MNLNDWWYGIVGLDVPIALLYLLATTHVTVVAVTVYLHRHSAHRSVDLHGALSGFFRFWLWLSTGMSTKEWTAVHRKHHATTETEADPHSPRIHGLRAILLRGTEYYRDAGTPETLEKYGKGTPDDWWERRVAMPLPHVGIALMAVIDIALFGSVGLVIWALQMLWIPFFGAGIINGVGHRIGYRNFETADDATNIVPWAVLVGGEELHNNHHTYPNSAKFSVKPWEVDIGWGWLRLFSLLGLAQVRSTGPITAREAGKSHIDMDTVWAVLNDRFRVMSRYAEQVVKPLAKAEMRDRSDSRFPLRRARQLLCRDRNQMGDRDRADIDTLVASSTLLKTIYEKREELLAVWSKRGGNREDLLHAFKDWCRAAEETGIHALGEFVRELKSYTMPPRAAA